MSEEAVKSEMCQRSFPFWLKCDYSAAFEVL